MESQVPFFIERTRNRTSRATIRDNAIVIRLARNLPEREESRHIEGLLKRMTKAFLKEQTRTVLDCFRDVLKGENTTTVHLVTGQSVRFEVESGATSRIKKMQNGWHVTRAPHTDKRAFHRTLWRLLAKSAIPSVTSLVRGINEETAQGDVSSVTLKFMRSRWGSCGRRGQIALSTPLLLTSPDILRYVIVHELSHIPHPNHSARFWNTVERFMPEYRQRMDELRLFRLPH